MSDDFHDDDQRIARIEAENEHAVLDPNVIPDEEVCDEQDVHPVG